MGLSILPTQFSINGVIDPTAPVFQNMERLANNSGCWLTYDVHQGKWSVVINQAGTSAKSFDDSNLIGSVSISGTGITEMYNGVKVNYPLGEINDEVDFIKIDIDSADRQQNEEDNVLDINLDLCNDPVQAQHLGLRELKQSRVDLMVSFKTDYSAIDLNAGDIIDITNSHLGWTNKLFRIMTLSEFDDDDGGISIEITALEYDADVYINDLERLSVSNSNGIVTKGGLGTPSTPTITLFERDQRPRALFATTTSTGIVEGVEFWISSDGTNYNLAGTTRPFDLGTYAPSTAVDFELDQISPGTIHCKVRAINDQSTGAFSSVSTAAYTPIQVTDVVTNSTELQDATTGSLLTGAGLSSLLVLLDELMTDSDDSAGSVYDKIFDVFNTDVGSDPRIPQQYFKDNGGAPVVFAFQTNFFTINNAYNTATTYSMTSFTAPYTGYYKVRYNANWGGGNPTDPLALKNTKITCNKTFVNQGTDLTATGGTSSQYEDHIVEGIFYANATDSVSLGVEVYHAYPVTTYDVGIGIQAEVALFDYSLFSSVTMTDD